MAIEAKIGPLVCTGNLSPVQNAGAEAGPSVFADGTAVIDDRFVSLIGSFPPKVYALNSADEIWTVDAFPMTPANNNIVAAQGAGAGAGTSLTLAGGTVQSAVANVPILPWTLGTDVLGNRMYQPAAFTSTNVVTAGLALDFGMCAGTTFTSTTVTLSALLGVGIGVTPSSYAGQTVNKNQIVVLQTTNHVQPEMMFVPGQPIIIANAGNAGGTIPLLTTVLAIDYVNHYLYIANPALSAQTNAGIANANAFSSTAGIAYWPYQQDGATLLFDARHGLSRALSYVSTNAGDTTVTLTVSGWDVYGIPMTETITLNGTTAVAGKKAFKFIKSVTTGVASLVGNVNMGTGVSGANANGTVGLNIRSDAFSYTRLVVNDVAITASTGFTKADLTAPSATTGDVRGTYALQSAADGTKRVLVFTNPSQYSWSQSTNLQPQPVFGLTQF